MKTNLPREYYGTCQRNVQVKLDEIFAEKLIPANDSVRLLDQIMEEMAISPLQSDQTGLRFLSLPAAGTQEGYDRGLLLVMGCDINKLHAKTQ